MKKKLNSGSNVAVIVLGIDRHLDRISTCVESIKHVYRKGSNVDIGVATFGNTALPPSKELKKYCQQVGIMFYDATRQDFLEIDKNNTDKQRTHNGAFVGTTEGFHSNEILGKISISKFFYDLGYEEVYVLHNDVSIFRDFLPTYRKKMKDNWAFVSPYVQSKVADPVSLKDVSLMDPSERSKQIQSRAIGSRIALSILILNKKLIYSLYSKYKTEKSMHINYFNKYCMIGDVGFLQLFDNFNGFSGNPIEDETGLDDWWSADCSLKRILLDEKITHIHGDVLFSKYGKAAVDIMKVLETTKIIDNKYS